MALLSSRRRLAAVVGMLCLTGCATGFSWLGHPKPIAIRIEKGVVSGPITKGMVSELMSRATYESVLQTAATSMLVEHGWQVDSHAKTVLSLRLTALDDSLMLSTRSVRVGLGLRFEDAVGAREWSWGPRTIRSTLYAADRDVEPYLREAVARALSEGPPADGTKGLPTQP